MKSEVRKTGIMAALSSAVLLGIVPIFGKLAFGQGFSPMAVIAIRTTIAALLIFVMMVLWMRQYLYIYPVGLASCLLAGFINGLGSILYYNALDCLDAGIGHMLYSFYPLFVALWLLLDRQALTRLTVLRLALMAPSVALLLMPQGKAINTLGAVMMIGSAVLYALHMIINQHVLFEVPAQTVTLYTLVSMAVTVDVAFWISGQPVPSFDGTTWWPVLSMALITFLSRLTLFVGIKNLGGLQTALLGLAEVLVTVVLSQVWLGEHLTLLQWLGALLLSATLVLAGFDKITPQKRSKVGAMAWLNPPKISPTDHPWNSQL